MFNLIKMRETLAEDSENLKLKKVTEKALIALNSVQQTAYNFVIIYAYDN